MSDIVLQPIGRSPGRLADVAYQRISDAMLTGSIAPGTRLVMDDLAAQLDISRTPVRDALLRLEREGMIAPSGRKGYVVREVTDHDIVNVYEARQAIEGFAVRRVAELGGQAVDAIAVFLRNADDLTTTDPRAIYDANLCAHRAIVEAAGNPLLLEMFDDLWQRARGVMTFADYVARSPAEAASPITHTAVLDALQTGPDAAFHTMRDHIRLGMRTHLG